MHDKKIGLETAMTPNHFNSLKYLPDDEKQLWISFKRGDLKAYEQLFNLYYQDLYGYGLKLCSRKELVRDSIQSLFVTIWDRKEHLGEVRSVKAYLLASLRRNIFKTLRHERKANTTTFLQKVPEVSVQVSIEESIIQDELQENQRQALQKALECLPERQKEILFLKYYNGMSYDEIEDILSINYQSIRNHIYRALERLRTNFKDEAITSMISLLIILLPVFHFIS